MAHSHGRIMLELRWNTYHLGYEPVTTACMAMYGQQPKCEFK